MLRVKGKSLHEEGTVISVEVEGTARVFIRNPVSLYLFYSI